MSRDPTPSHPIQIASYRCNLKTNQLTLLLDAQAMDDTGASRQLQMILFLKLNWLILACTACTVCRGRYLQRYSLISIMLCYVFALSNYRYVSVRSIIASTIYRSKHMGDVNASQSYCSKLICRSALLLLFAIVFPFIIYLLLLIKFLWLKKTRHFFLYFRTASKVVCAQRYNVIAITLRYNLQYRIML